MKKVRLILAGFMLFGMTAVMAQENDSEKDTKKSDQYSTEQAPSSDTTSVQSPTPSNDAVAPAPGTTSQEPSQGTPTDTTAITPPEQKQMKTPETPDTPSK